MKKQKWKIDLVFEIQNNFISQLFQEQPLLELVMGLQQSKEDAEPILKMLRQVSLPVLNSARTKLRDLSINKCKMHVTKWELLLILQMNAKDIKTISQFICGSSNPTNIDVNSLFVLLVLTSQHIKLDHKMDEIINFVCFDIELEPEQSATSARGTVTVDEMKYMFQLGYQFLNRVSDLDVNGRQYYKEDQDENAFCGSSTELELINAIFGQSSKQEQIDRSQVISKLKQHGDVQKFLRIFNDGKAAHDEQFNVADTVNNSAKQDSVNQDDMNEALQADAGVPHHLQDDTVKQSDQFKEQNDTKQQVQPAKGHAQVTGDIARKLNESQISKVSKPTNEKAASNNPSQVSKQVHRVKILSSQAASQANSKEDGKSARAQKNHHCNEGQSPYSLVKMSKRIMELRNENAAQIKIFEQEDNVSKMSNDIQYIMDKQLEFYAQRQLMPCMHTMFGLRKSLEIQAGQGTAALAHMLNPKAVTNRDASMSEQDYLLLQHGQVRRTLRNNLDEFLEQNRAFLKYQQATAKAKMMHFYTRDNCRGLKRTLEQKKYRLLGQIQTLRTIYSTFVESNSDLEYLRGDKLYQNIYTQISNLYKSNLSAEFLVEIMDLKSKKRESIRFINFLQGALKILEKICSLESINVTPNNYGIPTLYIDAKQMVSDKLQTQKHVTHINILKKHKCMKIKMLNYFTNLGKLKALYKVQQSNTLPVEQIHNMFNDQIKKLQIKLQKVDSDLIQFIQNQQIKQNIYSSFFSSVGSISVIKCGIKGLEFSHIFDYFAMAIIKQRTYEAIWVQIDAATQKDGPTEADAQSEQKKNTPRPTKLEGHLGHLLKLQKMKHMDKLFNVGSSSDSVDSTVNHAKYTEELTELSAASAETATQLQKMMQSHTSLDTAEKGRNAQYASAEHASGVIKRSLQSLYQNLGLTDVFNCLMHFYENSSLKKKEFFLDQTAVSKKALPPCQKQLKELDTLENFFFDFVPLSEEDEGKTVQKAPDQMDVDFWQHLTSYSTSLRLIYQDEARKGMHKAKKEAQRQCADYLDELKEAPYTPEDFEEQFQKQRDGVFIAGIKVLMMINKKGYVNFFNLKYLSLPIEHSMQHNYWAYQVIKMHIQESLKAKISTDITQIAFQNEITIGQNPGIDEQRESRQDLINITQGSAGNISKSQLGRINSTYKEIFKVIYNPDQFDRKGKQSMFRTLIAQLDHHMAVIGTQVGLYRDALSQWPENEKQQSEKDMSKVRKYFHSKISLSIDEQDLQKLYQDYEGAFVQYNDLQNMVKQIDQLMAGSALYLKALSATLRKEISFADQGKNGNKDQVDFITKIMKDIAGVQAGLKDEAKKKLNTVMEKQAKQKIDTQKGAATPALQQKRGSEQKKGIKKAETSPTKQAGKAKPGDAFEQEVKDMESRITTQIVTMVTFQDLLIDSRQAPDYKHFSNQLKRKLHMANAKVARLEQLQKYLKAVCGLVEKKAEPANTLEGQLAQENQSRGAKIINAVMSGNIVDQIDIYHQAVKNESPQLHTQASFDNDSPTISGRNETFRSTQRGSQQLTQPQRCLNYLSNYLKQVCQQEDIFSSNRILKESYLFFFIQLVQVDHHQSKCFLSQKFNLKYAMEHDINVYEVQNTPVKKYLQSYEKQSMFIKNDIFQMLSISEEQLLISKFFEIISKQGNEAASSVLDKVDAVFGEANLFDEEKTDFQNASTKIRRLLDQNLRTFREWLDAEANKKLAQVYESSTAQQEMKLIQSTTALQILVQIYYMKQIQQQEDFMYSLSRQRPAQ